MSWQFAGGQECCDHPRKLPEKGWHVLRGTGTSKPLEWFSSLVKAALFGQHRRRGQSLLVEFSRSFIPQGDPGTEDQGTSKSRDFYAGEAGGEVT